MTDDPKQILAEATSLLEAAERLRTQLLRSDVDPAARPKETFAGIVARVVENLGPKSPTTASLAASLREIHAHIQSGNMVGAAWGAEYLTAALQSVIKVARRGCAVTPDALLEARQGKDALDAMASDCFDKERFLQLLPQLSRNRAVEEALSREFDEATLESIRSATLDDEGLVNDVLVAALAVFEKQAPLVLHLEWDTGSPMGGNGHSSIHELEGVFLFRSTDYPMAGPFESIDDALESCESFSTLTPRPVLTSSVLPIERLLEVAEELVDMEDGSSIWINDREYAVRSGQLRPE